MFIDQKNTLSLAFAAVVFTQGVALAQDDVPVPISANLTFTTDYVWRGVSLSSEKFAVQGALTGKAKAPESIWVPGHPT